MSVAIFVISESEVKVYLDYQVQGLKRSENSQVRSVHILTVNYL